MYIYLWVWLKGHMSLCGGHKLFANPVNVNKSSCLLLHRSIISRAWTGADVYAVRRGATSREVQSLWAHCTLQCVCRESDKVLGVQGERHDHGWQLLFVVSKWSLHAHNFHCGLYSVQASILSKTNVFPGLWMMWWRCYFWLAGMSGYCLLHAQWLHRLTIDCDL